MCAKTLHHLLKLKLNSLPVASPLSLWSKVHNGGAWLRKGVLQLTMEPAVGREGRGGRAMRMALFARLDMSLAAEADAGRMRYITMFLSMPYSKS